MTTRGTGSWSGQRRAFPAKTRRLILARQPWCANGCGRRSTEADHIVPHAQGGSDHESNGQGLCSPCHAEKTKREIAAAQARRNRRRPTEPHPGLINPERGGG